MNQVKNLFSIYKGLKREIYVLSFGRIVTSMGALIWPMMTLILKSKLGFSAGEIGLIMMVMSLAMIPMNLIGGKLADHFNKKNIIVIFDFLSVVCFVLCGLVPLSTLTLLIYFVGSIFQSMEGPSYDSLVADLTTPSERERAYSLNYLSMNLGLVLSPIIGGILFENHLNLAFIISGCAILISTLLIFFFVEDIKKEIDEENQNIYETQHEGNVFTVLKKIPLLYLFFLISALGSVVYAQFNFLIPLNLESIFSTKGAFYFGILTSVNATVVIVFTPIFTKLFSKWKDLDLMMLGCIFQISSLSTYIFNRHQFWICVVAMIIFTFGEIVNTLANIPYLTKRIPSSHRGRILSISNNIIFVLGSMANYGIGKLVEILNLQIVWIIIVGIGVVELGLFVIYRQWDHRTFQLLYGKNSSSM